MNWKRYKNLSPTEKYNETNYIIGLDVGNDSSAIAFYNLADGVAEGIDLSGGYGKQSIPTAMQYVAESKEWVFGEYAVLGGGAGTVFPNLFELMGQGGHVDVDGRSVRVASVFALFIKELLGNVKNINPKAEIVGIVASVPAYFSAAAYEEFTQVFKIAGYEKELIALVPDRECVLARHYQTVKDVTERTLLLDLGSRELRGGLYSVKKNASGLSAVSMSSVFDSEISMAALNSDVEKLFESFLTGITGDLEAINTVGANNIREEFHAFTHQHKDVLFQKNIRTRPLKLYYNFVYPPVQHTITVEQVDRLVAPYVRRFNIFIRNVLEKNLYNKGVLPQQVDTVLCGGGGFEMLWAKEVVTKVFPKERVQFFKNPKMITAEGAALIAARELDLTGSPVSVEDNHQLKYDIGLADGENFLPLVERNGFWWQKHPSKLLLVNSMVNGTLELHIATLSPTGEGRSLANIHLDGLPARPKGVTRLEIGVKFHSNTDITITVKDQGFGDLFPQSDYEQEFAVSLGE
ncbi:MAG: DUF5716 family protein [Defluviitaleaceae bacterium]|nr:DUF5716 family protein [Defluviitaleaceae bacterium]